MKNKIISIACLLLFTILGILAINGYTKTIDNFIYEFLIRFKSDIVTNIMKFISFMFSTVMIVTYCILALILCKNKRKSIFLSTMMASEALINNIIKVIVKRPRPEVLHMVVEKTYSFPSGHTMAATVFLIIFGNFMKEKFNKNVITTIQVLLILLTGISRIYLGVHYFTDIIGALLLSFAILYIVKDNSKIKNWLEKSSTI